MKTSQSRGMKMMFTFKTGGSHQWQLLGILFDCHTRMFGVPVCQSAYLSQTARTNSLFRHLDDVTSRDGCKHFKGERGKHCLGLLLTSIRLGLLLTSIIVIFSKDSAVELMELQNDCLIERKIFASDLQVRDPWRSLSW